MAKSNKKSVVNMSLLAGIGNGSISRVSQVDGLLLRDAGLIEINHNDVVDGLALCRITDAGKAALPNGHDVKSDLATADVPQYAILSGVTFVPGERKSRGRSGAKTIYPWATMEVGSTFFVPVSAKHPEPVKSLTSAVSSANMKYSEEVGEPKEKIVTKRGKGNKAELDAAGNPVKVTVMRRDRVAVKKFELRAVTKGETIGNWSADADGVIVGRVI